MDHCNDFKLRSIKSISLRNLYLSVDLKSGLNDTKSNSVHLSSPIKEEKYFRRRSLFQPIPSLETPTGQSELLLLNTRKLLDSFFTLHVLTDNKTEDKLIYVSEVIRSNMNPNFGQISLPSPLNDKEPKFLLKIWCKTSIDSNPDNRDKNSWQLLNLIYIDLKKLCHIGESLVNIEDYFHNNSIIFNLNGRLYTIPGSLKIDPKRLVERSHHTEPKSSTVSYSFDSIRSLNSLSSSLKELSLSKHKLFHQIADSIDSLTDLSNLNNIGINLSQLKAHNKVLEKYISKQKSVNDGLMSEIISTKIKIKEIELSTKEDIPSIMDVCSNQIEITESQIEPIKEVLIQSIYPSIIDKLQEITKTISEIITIDNINSSIKFNIMGLEFPSSIKELLDICYYNKHDLKNFNISLTHLNESEMHNYKIEQINAGLSYIVQLINILADITNSPLKHKMIANGNRCIIIDPITSPCVTSQKNNSDNKSNTEFALTYPLYYNQEQTERILVDQLSSDRKYLLKNQKFEQGLNLLNKNLILLITNVMDIYITFYHDNKDHKISNNIPADCLDNFLWNLKYLVLFITAPINVN